MHHLKGGANLEGRRDSHLNTKIMYTYNLFLCGGQILQIRGSPFHREFTPQGGLGFLLSALKYQNISNK